MPIRNSDFTTPPEPSLNLHSLYRLVENCSLRVPTPVSSPNRKSLFGKHREDGIILPALWTRRFPKEGRDGDEHAAYATAAWLQRADQNCSLGTFLNPELTQEERQVADIEGWILGVV